MSKPTWYDPTRYDHFYAALMGHLMTPFGRCLCGYGFPEIDDHEAWARHVAEVLDAVMQ